MQITFPSYYKKFSCIADQCPDTCCAGWQIMIDEKSLKKYQQFHGVFRNRLHNDIDWKEQAFRQYDHRCAFLNDKNLCDLYTEAGPNMLCDTCRRYPRHIEEYEGLREISLSLSCPHAARIILSQEKPVRFRTVEKSSSEEMYDDFDYFLFTALMDTRDYLLDTLQDRSVPVSYRIAKLLVCVHDLQLCVDKNELFSWETICSRHKSSAYKDSFLQKITKRCSAMDSIELQKQIWHHLIPQLEVLSPQWLPFVEETLTALFAACPTKQDTVALLTEYQTTVPGWEIQKEQLLVYWLYTYFCGSVYDDQIFAKAKMAVLCTLLIEELALGQYVKDKTAFSQETIISISYRLSRELEHSDQNLNQIDSLMDTDSLFSLENFLTLCQPSSL